MIERIKLYTLFPSLVLSIYLVVAVINYYLGFTYFPGTDNPVWLFYLVAACLFQLGYVVSLKTYRPRKKPRNPHPKSLKLIITCCFVSTLIGYVFQISDSLMRGIDVSLVLEATSEVRKMQGGSILTFASVIFFAAWLPGVAGMTYLLYTNKPVGMLNVGLLGCVGLLTALNAFLSVNRNPILGYGFVVMLCFIIGKRIAFNQLSLKRLVLPGLLASAAAALFVLYSIFIVNQRAEGNQAVLTNQDNVNARYRIPTNIVSDGQMRFLVSTSNYLSHQFGYVDTAIDTIGWVNFNPQMLNHWLLGQASQYLPPLRYFMYADSYDNLNIYYAGGIPRHTWQSIVGSFVRGFGWLGGGLAFLLFGVLFGRITAVALFSESYLGMILLFAVFQAILRPFMMFNFDMYSNGAVFYFLLFIVLLKTPFFRGFWCRT